MIEKLETGRIIYTQAGLAFLTKHIVSEAHDKIRALGSAPSAAGVNQEKPPSANSLSVTAEA